MPLSLQVPKAISVPILVFNGYCSLNVSHFRDVVTREPPQQLSCFIQGGADNPGHVGGLVLHHCGSVKTGYCDSEQYITGPRAQE